MNELTKTGIFVGGAILAVAIAALAMPRPGQTGGNELPESLVEGFSDPTAVTRMELSWYDQTRSRPAQLVIDRRSDGRWVIASHDEFPTGDKDKVARQIRQAAGQLVDLEVIELASEIPSDHEQLGVLPPGDENAPAEDAGMLVALRDSSGNALARVIIGRSVEGAPDQRFIRLADADETYVVEIDPRKFLPGFSAWIKQRPLGIDALKISAIELARYKFLVEEQNGRRSGRFDKTMDVRFDLHPTTYEWSAARLLVQRGDSLTEGLPGEGETLDRPTIELLRRSLIDMPFLSAERKPTDIYDDGRYNPRLTESQERVKWLLERGFYPRPVEKDFRAGIVVRIPTQLGVEYVLYFGNIAELQQTAGGSRKNRYLMVSARVMQDVAAKKQPTADDLDPQAEEKRLAKLPPDEQEELLELSPPLFRLELRARATDPDTPERIDRRSLRKFFRPNLNNRAARIDGSRGSGEPVSKARLPVRRLEKRAERP